MPGLFRRREPITPAFPTVPTEAPDVAQAVAEVDAALVLIACAPPEQRNVYVWLRADRLLDQRFALGNPPNTPAPGRVDSIIDNYWENP